MTTRMQSLLDLDDASRYYRESSGSWSSDLGVAPSQSNKYGHQGKDSRSSVEIERGGSVNSNVSMGRVTSHSEEKSFDCYGDVEDDVDYSHLLEDCDLDIDGFEPYYDHETNRIIMRMRMGNLIEDEHGEPPQVQSVQGDQSSSENHYQDIEASGNIDEAHWQHQSEYHDDPIDNFVPNQPTDHHRQDLNQSQLAYWEFMLSNPTPPPPPPPTSPPLRRNKSRPINTNQDCSSSTTPVDGQPPLLCMSSGSSSDTTSYTGSPAIVTPVAESHNHNDSNDEWEATSIKNSNHFNNRDEQLQTELFVSSGCSDVKDINAPGAIEERITAVNDKLENVLALYTDMIYSSDQSNLDSIRQLMNKDARLSSREVASFWIGLDCLRRSSSQQRRSLSSIQEIGPTSSDGNKPPTSCHEGGIFPTPNGAVSTPAKIIDSKMSHSEENDSSGSNSKRSSASSAVSFLNDKKLLMSFITNDGSTKSTEDTCTATDEVKTSLSAGSFGTTAKSTMSSCRELSIQRLKRRLKAKSKREETEVQKLLKDLQEAQDRQKLLEKQLNKAGISIAEDIPYDIAKEQVAKIAHEMQQIGSSQGTRESDPIKQKQLQKDYYVLEQQMEKYMKALELTDEYIQEQYELEKNWDESNREANQSALMAVWKHMPVDVRQHSIDEWLQTRTPSGNFLPKTFVLKFSRTNILTLLRMNPTLIGKSHPSNFEQLRVSGLTLTERRAIEAHIGPIATKYWQGKTKDLLTKRKWNWYCVLRENLKDAIRNYDNHVSEYYDGVSSENCNVAVTSGRGSCACACASKANHTRLCPVKANQKIDYFLNDYGYPCDVSSPQYESGASTSRRKDDDMKCVGNKVNSADLKMTVGADERASSFNMEQQRSSDDRKATASTINSTSQIMRRKLKQRAANKDHSSNATTRTRQSILDELMSRQKGMQQVDKNL